MIDVSIGSLILQQQLFLASFSQIIYNLKLVFKDAVYIFAVQKRTVDDLRILLESMTRQIQGWERNYLIHILPTFLKICYFVTFFNLAIDSLA